MGKYSINSSLDETFWFGNKITQFWYLLKALWPDLLHKWATTAAYHKFTYFTRRQWCTCKIDPAPYIMTSPTARRQGRAAYWSSLLPKSRRLGARLFSHGCLGSNHAGKVHTTSLRYGLSCGQWRCRLRCSSCSRLCVCRLLLCVCLLLLLGIHLLLCCISLLLLLLCNIGWLLLCMSAAAAVLNSLAAVVVVVVVVVVYRIGHIAWAYGWVWVWGQAWCCCRCCA